MFRKILLVVCLLCFFEGFTQEGVGFNYKNVAVTSDTLRVSGKSINPTFFKLTDTNQKVIDTSQYYVDFTKGIIVFKNQTKQQLDSVQVRYLDYPDFLTKTYTLYDKSRIVDAPNSLLALQKDTRSNSDSVPFDGLTTSGSLSRGITIGNNQNAVVNSNLDLQLSGRLSDGVTLRASIQDDNIPIQDGGYSQKLDQFDQVYMELEAKKWRIRGGDLFLENRDLSFLNFNKKVQGVATDIKLGKNEKTRLYNSVGIVRGQYAKSQFVGQEGNQGPYKLKGANGELFVLVISGSERVFVNGVALKRGEANDYMIDYGAGEVRFNATYPITSEMRITVEYQYSDRNYNRFITYNSVEHKQDHWHVGGYAYIEGDLKNQPLQQTLTDGQKQILTDAGDDKDLMITPSAVLDVYEEGKVVYNKTIVNGQEVFILATEGTQDVYKVQFSFTGNNNGDYVVLDAFALEKAYEYVVPINGVRQGSYAPFVSVVSPINLQVYAFEGGYNKEGKTVINTEVSMSRKDNNTFSKIDDEDNQGVAGKFEAKQRLFTGKWNGDAYAKYQLVQNIYNPVERVLSVEFNRDWNVTNPLGTQRIMTGGLDFELPTKGNVKYQFDRLQYGSGFEGKKHALLSVFKLKKWNLSNNTSLMQSDGGYSTTDFARTQTQARYHFYKNWVGGSHRIEDNQEILKSTNQLSAISQRFSEWGAFVGRGDSTKVYTQIGYLERKNDSLHLGKLKRVNISQSYYLKSQVIQQVNNDLSVFVNYRRLKYTNRSIGDTPSLNSRLSYQGSYFKKMIQTELLYENTSGSIAQQDFTYVEVEPGLGGVYTWIDYNENGVKELSEFEVAQFTDQATYVRLFLPNQTFLKTHQNKFSNTFRINPSIWQNKSGFKKLVSHFYNQTSYLIERKEEQDNNGFHLNPFTGNEAALLGLNSSFRNSLFYNRGLQKHSLIYSFVEGDIQNLLVTGRQSSENNFHQLQYNHLLQKSWLFTLESKYARVTNDSENFTTRNYQLKNYEIKPKVGYLFSMNTTLDVFYKYQSKTNQILGLETLSQQQLGFDFSYVGKKRMTIKGLFSWFENEYTGQANSAVGYQMLEGLQPGSNLTWQLLIQKNITQYLDINVNYQGRQSESDKAIHTGSMQLRAFF